MQWVSIQRIPQELSLFLHHCRLVSCSLGKRSCRIYFPVGLFMCWTVDVLIYLIERSSQSLINKLEELVNNNTNHAVLIIKGDTWNIKSKLLWKQLQSWKRRKKFKLTSIKYYTLLTLLLWNQIRGSCEPARCIESITWYTSSIGNFLLNSHIRWIVQIGHAP